MTTYKELYDKMKLERDNLQFEYDLLISQGVFVIDEILTTRLEFLNRALSSPEIFKLSCHFEMLMNELLSKRKK